MKIKLEIDVSDIVSEIENYGEYTLHNDLMDEVKREIVKRTSAEIYAKVGTTVCKIVNDAVDKETEKLIVKAVEEFSLNTVIMQSKSIRRLPSGNNEAVANITLQDLIEANVANRLRNDDLQRGVDRYLIQAVDKSVEQIKSQYDTFYALQIVNKLNTAGMLKEGVIEALIPKGGE